MWLPGALLSFLLTTLTGVSVSFGRGIPPRDSHDITTDLGRHFSGRHLGVFSKPGFLKLRGLRSLSPSAEADEIKRSMQPGSSRTIVSPGCRRLPRIPQSARIAPKHESRELAVFRRSHHLPLNTTLKVNCIRGYKAVGSNKARCTDDGEWTWLGTEMRCQHVACTQLLENPRDLEDRNIRRPPSSKLVVKVNHSITFSCREGSVLRSESATLKCIKRYGDSSLVFNGSLPICEEITCSTCHLFAHGLTEYRHGKRVHFDYMPSSLPVNTTLDVGCQFCLRPAPVQEQSFSLDGPHSPTISSRCANSVRRMRCVRGPSEDVTHGTLVLDGVNDGEMTRLRDLSKSCFRRNNE